LLVIVILFTFYSVIDGVTRTYKHHGSFSGLPPSRYPFYCYGGYRLYDEHPAHHLSLLCPPPKQNVALCFALPDSSFGQFCCGKTHTLSCSF
jgi:hypothetical protein